MDKQSKEKKTGRFGHEERIFSVLMLLFAIFEIILLAVVLSRTFAGSDPNDPQDPNEEESSSETESESESDPEPPASVPVFSGAVIPTLPRKTAATVTLSGIGSKYAVLVNAETGEIVAGRDFDTVFSPASMTKVMTLIVACENLTEEDLDQTFTMTQEIYDYVRRDGYAGSSCYGIDVGDEYKLRDLLYGIGMVSASDCVLPIVLQVTESEAEFVEKMNAKVAELGLKNTQFDNAIGYESDGNYTTAADMAAIMAYAMQSDVIADILSKEVHKGTAAGYNSAGEFIPSFTFTFYNTFLGSHESSRETMYEDHYGKAFSLQTAKLIGGKTGWTTANSCLVAFGSSKSGGTDYVLVLGASEKMYTTMADVKTILDTYVQ